ncbi:putative ribonuclease H-like domain-containing protein [Tanacetum coccineum]
MWEASKLDLCGKMNSKKMQKYILKQQFKGFSVSNSERLHKGYDMFRSLLSQLEIHGAGVSTEDLDVKGSTASSTSTQNVAFISENTSSTNEEESCSLMPRNQLALIRPKSSATIVTRHSILLENADLRGIKIVGGEMLDTLGIKLKTVEGDLVNRRNLKLCNSGSDTKVTSCSKECKESYAKLKKLYDEQRKQLDDKTDVLTYHKKLLAEAEKEKEELKAKVEKWHNSSKNLNILLTSQISARDKVGLGYGNQMNKGVLSYENEVFESVFYSRSSDIEDSPVNDRYAKGMHVVPPPMTGIYIPSGPDVEIDKSQFTYGPKQSKPSESDARSSDFNSCESNSSEETLKSMPEPVVIEPKVVSQPKFWSDAPIIEEYESDSDDDYVTTSSKEQETPSFAFVNTVKHVKTPRQTVKEQNTCSQNPKPDKKDCSGLMSKKLGLGYGFTKKACLVCGSFIHLIRDCDFHEKRMAKQAELNKRMCKGIGQRENRPVWNNVQRVNHQNQFVPTAVLTRTGRIPVNIARASSTNNVNTARHKLNSKAVPTNAARKVHTMCDKKNKVLFTDTECLVLSSDFKLPDENQVLLRVPRQNNMYSFNLENIVPSGGLACLIAKATVDESNKWHRRLGHVNFKNLNKLVKGNLVRGLPSKIFQNDHTCVACQKGKQHKASCKAKVVSSISQPLQLLHMDLFGPTSVRSINHKTYCLVITDDFSRFSWVFFLRTKDETSGILKDFIRQIENQLNQKVKTIRCDNGTEFKNRDIIEFCGSKGIKREYSNARTPQQNGVAERKNRTLIEAARTMLADSFLPNTFWAEAVSTACYVLNRVLVTKPQNKTPYELITGKIPIISYIRPFGCHVTILNTIDHLGKFEEKSDEGFLVGYSLNSKAFRVYNLETKRVEENLHINFLENKPNVVGKGPNWLFDLDYLTDSMSYQPVTTENKVNKTAGLKEANHSTGIQDNIDAGNSKMEVEPAQEYFEELLQFKIQKVWILVDLPFRKNAIGTKWVYRNKKDERGIVVRNKARIEAIRIFLAFASYMGFIVYQMDVKSAFLYDIIDEEVYVSQPLGFVDPKFPKNVYKVVKALYGLHQAPRAWYATLFTFLLKSGYRRGTIDKTLFIKKNKNDIMLVQVTPKTLHLHVVKRIFRYLKGKPKLGLWYPRMLSFDLEAYSESDYARANLDRKSTTGEYVAAANCCGQVLWVQNQLLDYGFNFINIKIYIDNESTICIVKNLVFHSKTKHIEIRHHFIRDAYERNLIQMLRQKVSTARPKLSTARIEAIRIFLAFASYMGFIVYQMDVKSAFLYSTIDEEVYVSQPPGFVDPKCPKKSGYRRGTIDKTLFIKKDKKDIMLVQVYVDDIIFGSTKKSWCDEFEALMKSRFQMSSIGELTFFLGLQVKQKEDGIFISQDKSMIGSLMYLTASRPNIMFAVCACSRIQVTPKTSHLNSVKRIFRYLKGKPKLGLWYPRVSSFDLEAYLDSDYAGANLDRKSITGGCQFLGRRLISWQCKKQTSVATSTTVAEYVVVANCCGQVL